MMWFKLDFGHFLGIIWLEIVTYIAMGSEVQMTETTRCWICGDVADSKEHKTKKSDLKSVAGDVSQSKPIYLHTVKRQNQPIGSLNANALKYQKSLCQYCNNTRTQPHDFAWQRLSETLRLRQPPITAGQWIRWNKIFRHNTKHEVRHIHLYILKQFGCMLVEGLVKGDVKGIDIQPFASAILNNEIHPNVYAAFGAAPNGTEEFIAGNSDLDYKLLGKQCAFAVYFHHVGNFWMQVLYAIDGEENRQGLIDAWNPKLGSKRLRMKDFSN